MVINYPTIKRARFWMTFGQQYLKHLEVIQNIGMSRIDEVVYEAELVDEKLEARGEKLENTQSSDTSLTSHLSPLKR